MLRRILAVAILGAIVMSGTVDLGACGDKFLRVGKSNRRKGYAAAYRAAILIYTPAKASERGIRDLEDLLKRAGHTPRLVKNGASVAQAFADAQFDFVIAAYADAGSIKSQLAALPTSPGLLPVLHNPTKAIEAEAERDYPFLLKTHAMHIDDALEAIDDLMAQRLKPAALSRR
jgi:hypothetical protein